MVFSLNKNFNKNKFKVDASAKLLALSKFDSSLKGQDDVSKKDASLNNSEVNSVISSAINSEKSDKILSTHLMSSEDEEFSKELPADELVNKKPLSLVFSNSNDNNENSAGEPDLVFDNNSLSEPQNSFNDLSKKDYLSAEYGEEESGSLRFQPEAFEKVSEEALSSSEVESANQNKLLQESNVLNFKPKSHDEHLDEGDSYSPDNFEERFGVQIESALSTGTVIEGKFKFDKPVRIDGSLIGEVSSSSLLIVGSSAEIDGDISVGTLIVLGRVKGTVRADELIEISDGASLEGNIITSRLCIDDGAFFQGNCEMKLASWSSGGETINDQRLENDSKEGESEELAYLEVVKG